MHIDTIFPPFDNITLGFKIPNVLSNVYPENMNADSSYFCDENIRCTIPNSKCNKYNIPMPQTTIKPKNMNIMYAKNI